MNERGARNAVHATSSNSGGKLTDDEIDQMEGNAEILSGKLQERYGLEKDEAERQAREFRSSNNWN